jgi:hypothetical protein
MAISEDISNHEFETMPLYVVHLHVEDIPPSTSKDVEPYISMHGLICISTPQTLKLIGYIKNHKVIVLIDSGITHNFILQHVA